jgi:multiple sugar transport system substrate-binding protein
MPYNTLSRRQFLKTAGIAGAGLGLAGLAACTSPAAPPQTPIQPTVVAGRAKTAALKLLLLNHFVPAYDEWIKKFATDWGQANGVTVTIDLVPNLEIAARGASEVAAQKGHDIVQWDTGVASPILWRNHTIDLTELIASEIEVKYGKFSSLGRQAGFDAASGTWFALPTFYTSSPALYRKDLWDQVGVVPDTWDQVLEGGRKLKALGNPIGIPLGRSTDPNVQWRGLIWSFGGAIQDQDQQVVINSPEVLEAVKFARALYKETMTDEVLTWDDTGNNKFLASGKGSWIINPPSAYRSIQKADAALADKVYAWKAPQGPKARLMGVVPHAWTTWKFAENQQNALEFMRHFVNNFKSAFEASTGYNMPMNAGWVPQPMPILSDDPTSKPTDKLAVIQTAPDWSATFDYPGPNSPAIGEVVQTYVIPDMMTQAATDKLTPEEAVKWGEEQVKRIFKKWQV